MRAKLSQGCCIVLITLGIHYAHAANPPGLREALAEFETGATQAKLCSADYMIGSRKEISRFQILPSVWDEYSTSRNYHDPRTAWTVTTRILRDRERVFRTATNREWDYVDIYILWNAPGQYHRAKWDRSKVSRIVRQRAQRFANLMEERAKVYTAQNVAQN